MLVAHVFKETDDWSSGELVMHPLASKPWRTVEHGAIIFRALSGRAWLRMRPTDGVRPLDGPEPASAVHVCAGDWVLVPSAVDYSFQGAAAAEAEAQGAPDTGATEPFRAVWFARYRGPPRGTATWEEKIYEGPERGSEAMHEASPTLPTREGGT